MQKQIRSKITLGIAEIGFYFEVKSNQVNWFDLLCNINVFILA